MNLQVIASPALPGSVHDKKAEWIWGVLDELEKAGLVTLAEDKLRCCPWRAGKLAKAIHALQINGA
jgi:hypothetical protein